MMRYKLRSSSKLGAGTSSVAAESSPSSSSSPGPSDGAGASSTSASSAASSSISPPPPPHPPSTSSAPSLQESSAAAEALANACAEAAELVGAASTSRQQQQSIYALSPQQLGPCTHSDLELTPLSNDDGGVPPPPKRQRVVRRRVKSTHKIASSSSSSAAQKPPPPGPTLSKCTITDIPQEVILYIAQFLDSNSLLALFQSCRWFHGLLVGCNPFWKTLCTKEELSNYQCLLSDDESSAGGGPSRLGWANQALHCTPPADYPHWRRVFMKGLKMRKNIWQSNYEGWRIYANSNVPVVKLGPDLDLNKVKQDMGDFPKLSENDDLKIDWDDRHLVVFHFFRGEGESCIIRLWDISEEPKFLYHVQKGLECITDKVSVINDHVVIVPSWPLEARAVVMTLDIKNQMREVGKFLFESEELQSAIDSQWEHTQLRVIKNTAMVVCRCPNWMIIVVELPSCRLLYEESLVHISNNFDCQQIRSYKQTAMILFARKHNENYNFLVTVDIDGKDTKVRSTYECSDVADVALFTNPEEIYIMKRNGDVVMYDANKKVETIKIANEENITGSVAGPGGGVVANPSLNEYQLFVNRKEQICVMQSAAEVPQGRNIKVYTYSEQKLYTINLDLCKYGMSRDESICIYTNGAFLAAADSKRFTMFNVKTGKYLGAIQIPTHLERTKGKEEKDCMFEQTGLSLFIFDEDKLIAVHDYERSFPAVLDIYKFW